MRKLWRIYRNACAAVVILVVLTGLALLAESAFIAPASVVVSPDGRAEIRIFTAGQGAILPDYRTDVRFYLRRRTGFPWNSDRLIASAPIAEGWQARWTANDVIVISAGRLSWFAPGADQVDGVRIEIRTPALPSEENACIARNLANALDGVLCFDALLTPRSTPARPASGQ